MEYCNFDLQIVPDGPDLFTVQARSASGEASDPVSLIADVDALATWDGDATGPGAKLRLPVTEVKEGRLGERLFGTLMTSRVGALFHRVRGEAKGNGQGVRIRLRFDPGEPRLARLAQLPWEMLFDPHTQRFLGLDPTTPIVRTFDVHERVHVPPLRRRPRLLLAAAVPLGTPPLDAEEELRRIREALGKRADLDVETLLHATRDELSRRLRDGRYDLVHLTMHGELDEREERGMLLLEYGDGSADAVPGPDFARQFHGLSPMPRLVVLNACLTAVGSPRNPLTSVAAAMVLGGCPAVIATTSPIFDEDAIRFSERLYERLGAGDLLEAALTEGRLALDRSERLAQWAIPCLYLSPDAPTDVLPPAPEAVARRARPRGLLAALVLVGAVTASLPWIVSTVESWGTTKGPSTLPLPPPPPPSQPVQSVQRLTVAKAGSTFDFEVRAGNDLPAGFESDLRRAAQDLLDLDLEYDDVDLRGWTAQVEVQPFRFVPSTCRASATYRWRRNGKSDAAKTVSSSHFHVDGKEACAGAASKLAQAVVSKLADNLKEKSP